MTSNKGKGGKRVDMSFFAFAIKTCHQRQLKTSLSTRSHGVTASIVKFDFPKIREEIIQQWLNEEAKLGAQAQSDDRRAAQYCCLTYQDIVKNYHKSDAKWHWLDRELSSNVAGETGAVYIYRGALSAMRWRTREKTHEAAQEFCQEHMANESAHLQYFERIIPEGKHTALLPVWRLAGWTLGFLPTFLGGNKALYVTVEAVETFVEEHYQEQIIPLREKASAPELVKLLEHCCEDEVHHKEDAAQKLLSSGDDMKAWWIRPWSQIVRMGSTVAAEIARRV